MIKIIGDKKNPLRIVYPNYIQINNNASYFDEDTHMLFQGQYNSCNDNTESDEDLFNRILESNSDDENDYIGDTASISGFCLRSLKLKFSVVTGIQGSINNIHSFKKNNKQFIICVGDSQFIELFEYKMVKNEPKLCKKMIIFIN